MNPETRAARIIIIVTALAVVAVWTHALLAY